MEHRIAVTGSTGTVGGGVARMLAAHGTVVLVPVIAPYAEARRSVRDDHAAKGVPFAEVFVSTSLEVAEGRDVKGLYKKARAGELKNFTGIDSPYEPPEHAEIVIDTTAMSATDAAEKIVAWLEGELDYSI